MNLQNEICLFDGAFGSLSSEESDAGNGIKAFYIELSMESEKLSTDVF